MPAAAAKNRLRERLERLLWMLLYRVRELPWGLDFKEDLERSGLPVELETIFDVGAHVGQSALSFSRLFPRATIWSFEPFAEPFGELERVTAERSVRCFQLAFGATPGTVSISPASQSSDSSLVVPAASSGPPEEIRITTLDLFAEEHAVERIDFLKVDTEGFDLEVLKGAERCLRAHAVTFVEVEAGMNPANQRHVPFEELKSFLEERGYVLFAVYEQVPEWSGEARLRFANPVFVAREVADRSAG